MKTYTRKYRAYFAGALLSIFISTAFAVILQFFKGQVLDYAVVGETDLTIRYGLLLIRCIVLEILFYFAYRQLKARFVVGCTRSLKHAVFDSIMRRSYVMYKEQPQGEYISKYMQESDTIQARKFNILPMFWEILFKIIFVSIALFVLDWRIALMTILLLTTPLYVPKLIEGRLQRVQAEQLKAVEDSLVKINDWFSGFEVIKNYSIERSIMKQFQEVNEHAMQKLLQDMQLGAVAQLISTLMSYLSYFLVLAFAAWLVLTGAFTAGDFFVAIGMIDQLSYPLISLADIIRLLVAIKPTCKAMEQFIKAPGKATDVVGPTRIAQEICFRDVSFAYQGHSSVLQHFNLCMQPKSRYLLRGPSGCGKTTVINLLLKYHAPDTGIICIDGKSTQEVSSTYGLITIVRQEAILFHDTLRNNLTMYCDVSDQQLIQVLNDVGLLKFAKTEALDAVISENGTNLSGGEKKRLSLARALLRQTQVLILDEPLANLDSETANRIEDLLLSIEDRLVLIVSHQFSEEKFSRFDQVLDLATSA